MAREILFKAKRADTKEWVEGYPVFDFADCSLKRRGKCACEHNGELLCFYGWIDELHEYGEIEVIPETVCQYTGLNDGTKWEELSEEEKEKFLSKRNHKEDRLNIKEDWNGRKIFEGDIVSVSHSRIKKEEDDTTFMPEYEEYSRNYTVEFVNKGGHCGYRCRNKSIHFTLTQNTIYNHNIDVIGNLWDNTELLNQ